MKLRAENIAQLAEREFDVLVVGAGINGAVSAAALAARGAKVAVIDRGDFGGFTSQESSNLVWGGIKYLESYELGLVRKLCVARNHLIESYPSTVREVRFYTALRRDGRVGRWTLFAGSLLYWLIGNLFTRAPRLLGVDDIEADEPLIDPRRLVGGVEYSDAYLHDNDTRFVFGFVRDALDRGASAANYIEARGSRWTGRAWDTRVRDTVSGDTFTIRARVLLNACGPYVDAFNRACGVATAHRHVFSKGVHLLVDRLSDSGRVLTFFADDGRLFFVIPMGRVSCIGTTDTRVDDIPARVSAEDRRFILDNINERLRLPRPLTVADVIAERCGVRPLVVPASFGENQRVDWTALSRKHVIDVKRDPAHISIFGGKLTDCINVGEEVCGEVERLGVSLGHERRWYGEPAGIREAFFRRARELDLDALTDPASMEVLSTRLWRRYGSDAMSLLDQIEADRGMAEVLIRGTEYTRCEIELVARREMVTRLDDFLRRRSKIALVMRRELIRDAPGLREACTILFGAEAEARLAEYLEGDGASQGERGIA